MHETSAVATRWPTKKMEVMKHERYGYQSRLYWRQSRKWCSLQNVIEQDGR